MNFLCEISSYAIGALAIVLLIVGCLVGIVIAFAGVLELILNIKLRGFASKTITVDKNANDILRHYLDNSGLGDVQIKRCNLFRLIFIGEGYSPKYNTIFLRRRIGNSKKVNLVANAVRYIGFARMEKEGDKKHKFVSRTMPFVTFAPFIILPMIIVGLAIDLASKNAGFTATIILSLLSLLFYTFTFVLLLMNIPIQKKANRYALEIAKSDSILSTSEIESFESLYDLFVTKYIADFLVSAIYLIKDILRIVYLILKSAKNK